MQISIVFQQLIWERVREGWKRHPFSQPARAVEKIERTARQHRSLRRWWRAQNKNGE